MIQLFDIILRRKMTGNWPRSYSRSHTVGIIHFGGNLTTKYTQVLPLLLIPYPLFLSWEWLLIVKILLPLQANRFNVDKSYFTMKNKWLMAISRKSRLIVRSVNAVICLFQFVILYCTCRHLINNKEKLPFCVFFAMTC